MHVLEENNTCQWRKMYITLIIVHKSSNLGERERQADKKWSVR